MVSDIPDYFYEVPLQKKIIKGNEAESSRYVANLLETHANILKYRKQEQDAAYYDERVKTLRARIDDFNLRAGK
ncbi:MAG: hypothetical protein ABIQ11_09430, partial [Saprospiraceae bacterium]